MKKTTEKTQKLVITGVLIAIIVVMSFTPLGYLKVGVLSITLLMIPVIVGAVNLGPVYGALLGLVFGATSFIQCYTGDLFGALLVSKSIPRSIFVIFVSRILAGFFCGLIFKALKKHDKKETWSYLVASICGSLFNTVFFLSSLALLFKNVEFTQEELANLPADTIIKTAIVIALSVNAIVEVIACGIVGTAITKALAVVNRKNSNKG